MIRGNRWADKLRNNNPHGKFWDYLPVENADDGSLESDLEDTEPTEDRQVDEEK